MQVLEVFQSKQGEGIWTGQPCVFVRFFGCPLHCRFCDTAYTRFNSEEQVPRANLTVDEIAGRVLLFGIPHVVLTGGEPMFPAEIVELTQLLKKLDYQITIETAGIIFRPVICDLMSISPKLRNTVPVVAEQAIIQAHNQTRWQPEIVRQLISQYNYQLKFVIDREEDFDDVEEYLTHIPDVVPNRVLMMPQAIDVETMRQKATWIEPFCRAKGFSFCPRMQLVWYGNKRRT